MLTPLSSREGKTLYRMVERTFKYSFEASCHSLFIVRGGGFACDRMRQNTSQEAITAIATVPAIFQLVPGGSIARGPWGPNAIQYAVLKTKLACDDMS